MNERPNTIAIVQARMGSTRLPKKVMLTLAGKSVLEHVVARVRSSALLKDVVVATTTDAEDSRIEALCRDIGVAVFRGSADDVLDRYYRVALKFRPAHIVRITADCPLMDHRVIDKVIEAHLASGADYTANTVKLTYPDGEDVEVMTFGALENAWKSASLASDREHVTSYIRKNPGVFRIAGVQNDIDLSRKRWTLDNEEDYLFIEKVYEGLYERDHLFGMTEILDFLDKNPKLEEINSHISRNEGYAAALKKDRESPFGKGQNKRG